jgi:hypothetical protein
MWTKWWVLFLGGAIQVTILFATAPDAWALGPIDIEVAGKLGGGTNPAGDDPNPLGVGLGARAGASFRGVYGGVSFVNYFGEDQHPPAALSVHSLAYGAEAGYGLKVVGPLTIRGLLGIGNFTEFVDNRGQVPTLSKSHGSLYVEPALTVILSIGPVLVGADASVIALTSGLLPSEIAPSFAPPTVFVASPYALASFAAHAQIGVTF